MSSELLNLPFDMALMAPPYDDPRRVTPASLERTVLPPGAMLALAVSCPRRDWELLPTWLPRLRAAYPVLPVVLAVDRQRANEMLHLARRAGRLRVRAVVVRDSPCIDTLRDILTEPEELAADVTEWLGLCGLRLSPALAHLIQQMFAQAHHVDEVTELLRRMGESETSARFRLRKKRLPSPRRWFQAARALRIALRVQARPGTSLMEIAFELGYADHSAISQIVQRTFGLRPNKLRGTLGWEWLLDRWLTLERAASSHVA
jgi:AraC-like DNA-binding protein